MAIPSATLRLARLAPKMRGFSTTVEGETVKKARADDFKIPENSKRSSSAEAKSWFNRLREEERPKRKGVTTASDADKS